MFDLFYFVWGLIFCFILRVLKHWNNLPRNIVESSPVEILQTWLNFVLSNILHLSLLEQECYTNDLKSLPNNIILCPLKRLKPQTITPLLTLPTCSIHCGERTVHLLGVNSLFCLKNVTFLCASSIYAQTYLVLSNVNAIKTSFLLMLN